MTISVCRGMSSNLLILAVYIASSKQVFRECQILQSPRHFMWLSGFMRLTVEKNGKKWLKVANSGEKWGKLGKSGEKW